MPYIIKDIDNAIMNFRGEFLFLSNFYTGKKFMYKGYYFTNTEAAFHAEKCIERISEFSMLGPSESKRLGRRVLLRKDWEEVKDQVMYDICYAKFTQDVNLMNKLLATGDKELVEGNSHNDKCWGMTYSKPFQEWRGDNRLGIVLMKLRTHLREIDRRYKIYLG